MAMAMAMGGWKVVVDATATAEAACGEENADGSRWIMDTESGEGAEGSGQTKTKSAADKGCSCSYYTEPREWAGAQSLGA